jgi:predicted nucleotidyltransferase
MPPAARQPPPPAHDRGGAVGADPASWSLALKVTPQLRAATPGLQTLLRGVVSVARGEEHAGSDVDFLMRFGPDSSLFERAGSVHDLEKLLGVEVDVISEGGLRESDAAMREDATAL